MSTEHEEKYSRSENPEADTKFNLKFGLTMNSGVDTDQSTFLTHVNIACILARALSMYSLEIRGANQGK